MSYTYTFPFDTCEPKRRHGLLPVQPFSCAINLASTLMLSYLAACSAATREVAFLLGTFAAFEAWHTLSHAVHLEVAPAIQNRVVHVLGYVMFVTTYLVMDSLDLDPGRRRLPTCLPWHLVVFAAADVAVVMRSGGGVSSIASGLLLYSATVATKFDAIPECLRTDMTHIMLGTGGLVLMFVNEAVNGAAMLRWRPLPYHAAVEVVGFFLFWKLGRFFLDWEALSLANHNNQSPVEGILF